MGYTDRIQGAQRSEDAPFFIVSHLIFGAKKKNNVSKHEYKLIHFMNYLFGQIAI